MQLIPHADSPGRHLPAARHQRRRSPSAPSPAGPGTHFLDLRTDEEFLSRFGDTIDDRIAEILDELLEERDAARQHRRLPQVLNTVGLILVLAASALLRHSAIAAWTIWPATAVVCLAASRTSSTGRSLPPAEMTCTAGRGISVAAGSYLAHAGGPDVVPKGEHGAVPAGCRQGHGRGGGQRPRRLPVSGLIGDNDAMAAVDGGAGEFRGASFTSEDFTGAKFRDCDLRQVKITDS